MGWTWLSLTCVGCNHRGEIKFDDFRIGQSAQPLGRLLRKAKCSRCGGRDFIMTIATRLTEHGQPFPHYLPIECDGDAIIAARRN